MSEKKQKMDLTGQTYGRWTVLKEALKNPHGGRQWKCRCTCGREKIINHGNLRGGKSKSCGCNPGSNLLDLTGQTYGRLTVLEVAEPKGKNRYWKCRCFCGNEVVANQSALRSGSKESCGCAPKKRKTYKRMELAGQAFGLLTVLTEAPKRGRTRYWACRCACGTEKVICQNELSSGRAESCGCLKGKVKENLTGKVYGRLTVLEEAPKKGRRTPYWRCRCSCGNEKEVRHKDLTNGVTKSCGCFKKVRPKRLNFVGQKFGRLVALEEVISEGNSHIWKCRCTCGNEITVKQEALKAGRVRSCGCLRLERVTEVQNTQEDLVGKTFDYVTVVKKARSAGSQRHWHCRCICGKNLIMAERTLSSQRLVSCGCMKSS